MCRTIIKGATDQLSRDGLLKDGWFGVQAADDDSEVASHIQSPRRGFSGKFRDDLTGQVLKDDLVMKRRKTELDFFFSKGVWLKEPLAIAKRMTGRPPIIVRWVDTTEGDEEHPAYRSRLIARQMKAHDHSGTSYFAPAPLPWRHSVWSSAWP